MSAKCVSERCACAVYKGLARRPAVKLPTIPAGVPTSHIGPILAPAEIVDNFRSLALSRVDIAGRMCYNGARSETVGHAVRGYDGDGRKGRQSILCKLLCGPNGPNHFIASSLKFRHKDETHGTSPWGSKKFMPEF